MMCSWIERGYPPMPTLTLIGLLGACTGAPSVEAPGDTGDSSIPVVDMASYLRACEAELGPWPDFDCAQGVEVPITVSTDQGTTVISSLSQLEEGFRCDRSSIGGCAPGTRIGSITNSSGSHFVFGCRNYDEDLAFDQINLIATEPSTGATCFFSTRHRNEAYGIGEAIPRPGSPEDLGWFGEESFWYRFDQLQQSPCLECHDNDPILHNPWIRQVDVLPQLSPLGPYVVVAQEALVEGGSPLWSSPRNLVHPATDPCTVCHRITDRRSCDLALEATGREPRPLTSSYFLQTYPYSRWMPVFDDGERESAWSTEAEWEAAWGAASDAVERCCTTDPERDCFE